MLKVLNASGAELSIVITDAEGNTFDSTAMELGKWYTASWTADGSASYKIQAFNGTRANGTYYLRDITIE
jgi:hypothetical protein